GGDPKDMWYGPSRIAVAPAFPAAGAEPWPLTAGLDRNATAPRFSADGRSVYFLIEEGGNSHLASVAVPPRPGAAGPLAKRSGAVVRVVDGERTIGAFDIDARGDIAVLDSVPERPAEVALVTRQGLRRLTTTNDRVLAGLRLAKVERFQAK